MSDPEQDPVPSPSVWGCTRVSHESFTSTAAEGGKVCLWVQQLLLVHPQAAQNVWVAVNTAAGILFINIIGAQDSFYKSSPHHNLWSETVRTRAATQGNIRFGQNYKGE